jgi:hypothetical protein
MVSKSSYCVEPNGEHGISTLASQGSNLMQPLISVLHHSQVVARGFSPPTCTTMGVKASTAKQHCTQVGCLAVFPPCQQHREQQWQLLHCYYVSIIW